MVSGSLALLSGLAGWASGLAARGGMNGRTNERTDGKSPHSTGLCPLSGPLPKKTCSSTVDRSLSRNIDQDPRVWALFFQYNNKTTFWPIRVSIKDF